MSEAFLGEIRPLAFPFAPKGWALCNGQLLQISQNTALFSLLGTTYGGDGVRTFALPNLQGRVPLHFGNNYALGQVSGALTHTLTVSELPQHNHLFHGTDSDATDTDPTGRLVAKTTEKIYGTNPSATMKSDSVGPVGQSQPHDNMQPYLTINFCIAIQGIYPSRS
jgi:microcystin-dependent protein